MRERLGPYQEQCFPTENDIHEWWYFLQGFMHTETSMDGIIGKPFRASASYLLKCNTSVEEA